MIEQNLIKPKTKLGLSIFLNSLSKWRNDLIIKKLIILNYYKLILDESGYSAMLKK
jgi:DNA helicase-2/ATP-dependent DNA helicase PcrA